MEIKFFNWTFKFEFVKRNKIKEYYSTNCNYMGWCKEPKKDGKYCEHHNDLVNHGF